MITLDKSKLEYTIRYRFKATNNKVKYESMITKFCLARALGARK